MRPEEVVGRLVVIEARTADRLGFPRVGGRSEADGIRAFREREERQVGVVETAVSLPDPVTQRVFLALCARYGVEVYRKPRQRSGNVTVRAPHAFVKDALGPMFQEAADVFQDWYVDQTEAVLEMFASSNGAVLSP
ncbi:MAG: hypothetical protein HC834_06325 [Rhodospirillales bacterium]|nr:hypothetical protein [Rhodospirillales bacterium]